MNFYACPKSFIKYIFILVFALCSFPQQLIAQTNPSASPAQEDLIPDSSFPLTISGKVIDKLSGEPLLGVSIVAIGTANGTTTNYDGEFEIYLEEPTPGLTFSYIGFKSEEVLLKDDEFLEVQLTSDINALDAVVVTALNIKKSKERIGYATQKVDGKDLVKTQEPNVISNLTGKVAGLTVFNSTDFFANPGYSLRGERPLIVIDGVPNTSTNLWELNGNDIESINVLKGAPASALYGSIGRNGAIMITTKRGSTDGGLQVEVSSNTMFQTDFLRVPETQSQYGSGRNGVYRYTDGTGSGQEGSGFSWGPRLDRPDPSTPSGFVELVQYNSPTDPETGEKIPLPWISRGEDNLDNFFRTGVVSNTTVAVTAGNAERNIRVSVGSRYQRGIVPNTELNNSNFSVSGRFKHDKLTVDASLNYNKQQSDNIPEVAFSSQSFIYNLALWMGANVDVNDLKDYWIPGQEGFQQRHYSTSFYNNPHFLANEFNRGYNRDVTYGQVFLTYDLAKDLTVNMRNGFNYFSLDRTTKQPISFVRDFNRTDGNFSQSYNSSFDFNTDVLMNFSKVISEDFNIQSTVGVSNLYRSNSASSVSTNGLNVPNFYNIANSRNALQGSNFESESRISSAYATLDLSFLNSIYLNFTGRNDWVTTLPKENNSFFYPSVSLSYVPSKMFDLPEVISNLRVRGSWAEVSNGDFGGTYSHIASYNSGINWQNNASLFFPGNLISPDLSPQTSSAFEGGLVVGFFENRLSFDTNFIYVRNFNNLTNVPISVASGFSSRLINANEFEKKGFELITRASPIKNKTFGWDVTFNLSQYRTYISEIDNQENIGQLQEGDRVDKLFTTVWQETPDGQPIIGNNGINIRDPYNRHIGYRDPDWVYGFLNNFKYKDFNLFVGIDGRIGGLAESKTLRSMWWSGSHPGTINEYRTASASGVSNYVADGVVVVGGDVQYDTEGHIINDTRQYAPNEQVVNYEDYMTTYHSRSYGNHYYDMSFLKLREVSLSYNFPSKMLENTFLETATISLIGRNLALWAEIDYLDPDSGTDQNMQTPSTRNFGIHFNAKF
ncbi:SusC/RagA family TonB-linked outer membrane protein [Psychroflexus salinarum]|uniref:SusC/RagA family TonB-linked outer membrane protein n=1 Tax=Psychroflexus salinarum TaxID=546024 RepID=A0ABW3GR08_9FLAO